MRSLLLCCAVVACAKPAPREVASAQQPLWAPTATQPSLARAGMPALTLPDGRVLVAGGGTSQTELFDPSTETWSLGPPLGQPQTGNLLELHAGRAVSLAGARAEALSATWSLLGAPATARTEARGVTLADGRLLVIGGQGTAQQQTELLELDGGFSTLAPSTAPHLQHTATLLPSGDVAVIDKTPELFDGTSWTAKPTAARDGHTASLLPNGQLLLVGGPDAGPPERYDPVTGTRTPVPGLRVPRLSHAALALPGGDVLITGGEGAAAARSAERYLFVLDRFVASGCLDTPRARHAAAVMQDGGALLVGGQGLDGGLLAHSERLDFTTGLLAQGQPCALDCECGAGFCVDGVCCDSACNSGACLSCATGTCALAASTTVCRVAAGTCDVDERCTGADAGCPTDLLRDAGASCRGPAGTCDFPEVCDGASPLCPSDRVFDAGASCRVPAGLCDALESCDGVTGLCPTDRVLDAGATCRAAAAGSCDLSERCDGVGTQCPSDAVLDAGVVCRPSDAGCDLLESCNGISASCPADSVAAPGVPCRASAGACDVAELCLGGRACPADVVRDAGASCRPSAGLCDVADVCDGLTGACADRFADAGAGCRAVAGLCDAPESCTGASAACPADARLDAGTPCRAATAACDRAEACDGTDTACPTDQPQPAGTSCRAAAGPCDAVEACDGTGNTCPADGFATGTPCRPAAGQCDQAETCSGAGIDCPADDFRPADFVCRMSAGACDVAETCAGGIAQCPPDAFAAATTVCRPGGNCDPEELCDGAAMCPPDAVNTCFEQPRRYVGWSCASVEGLAPLLALLSMLGRRRRHGALLALAVALAPSLARAEAPVTSDFSIRLNASLVRDLLASQLGAEVGANISLSTRFDAALALSLGRALGGRLGVTWHLKDDGEWVRPFIQARAIIHPVPEGIAGGVGGWAGLFVPLGPGRVQAGALFEAYVGPHGYVPYDAFLTIGYELDIYRRIEREGVKPGPDFGGAEVPPLKSSETPTPPPTQDLPQQVQPQPDERTRVVTRVSLAKDFVLFDERRASWVQKSEPTVRKVIEVLKRYPQLQRIEVSGHADDGDTDDECMQISLKRAERVLAELLQAGIEPTRLTAKAYGKLKNRVPTAGPARKRELNRRVDFAVLQETW